ncbi:PspC domain-containing protein [Rhodococcus sp. NPDC058514]|uniref:PspC domain-containing protein n=1 Tax=unclassified Rhodococcus (in: high G+C Gram-positive bacteria) TaxID=192944 RepID=UPI00364EC6D4
MTTHETETTKPKDSFLQDLPTRLPEQGMIAGVSAGVAQRLNVSTSSVRLALLLSLLFAGAGVPVYLAAWLLMRKPDETRSMGETLLDNGVGGESKTTAIVLAAATAITAIGCALPVGAGLLGMGLLVGGYLYLDSRK